MSRSEKPHSHTITYVLIAVIGVLLLGTIGYFIHKTNTLSDEIIALNVANNTAGDKNEYLTQLLEQASTTIDTLEEDLDETEEDLKDRKKDLRKEKDRNDDFEDQIETITDTVGDINKLAALDQELLQKYSKVSFLNEHYAPEKLKEIDDQWKYSEDKDLKLHINAMPFFEEMLEDAKDDGVDLWVVSAFRSFSTQAQLKGAYTVQYGSGANTFSADQGFSEHQLGTAIDFTTSGIDGGLTGFGNTEAYTWMLKNAHKYGFVLSYPEKNSYYIFEPWHWRFVGEDLAKDLERKNDYFYDWEQRDIDEYLLNIFD